MNYVTRLILGGFMSLMGGGMIISIIGSTFSLFMMDQMFESVAWDSMYKKLVFAQLFTIGIMSVMAFFLLKYGIRNVKRGLKGPVKTVNNDPQMADSEENYHQF